MQRATHTICRLALTAVVVCAMWPAVAGAQSYQVTPPSGWQKFPPLANSQADMVRTSDPFGGVRFGVKVTAHAKPQQGAFYVTWLEADQPVDDLGQRIRRAFDDHRLARIATSPQASSTEELSHTEQKADNVARMELSWRHISNETVTHSRTLVWATPDNKLRLVRAECVLSAGSPEESACKKAVASLVAGNEARAELGDIPAAKSIDENETQRKALQVGDLGQGDDVEDDTPSGDGGAESQGPELKAPTGNPVVYDNRDADEDESSGMTNKLLIIAGGVLLAVAFWFTTRRREDEPDDDEPDDDSEGAVDEADPGEEE